MKCPIEMRPRATMHHPIGRCSVWPRAVGRRDEAAASPARRLKSRRVRVIEDLL
jgi:hypothetical protein